MVVWCEALVSVDVKIRITWLLFVDIIDTQWRRGDSNPRPEMFHNKHLHA